MLFLAIIINSNMSKDRDKMIRLSSGFAMEFCPQCHALIMQDNVICPYCGYNLLYNNKDKFLNYMEKLLERERIEAKNEAIKDRVPAEVIDFSDYERIVTLSTYSLNPFHFATETSFPGYLPMSMPLCIAFLSASLSP